MANDYTPQQIEEILQMFFDVAGTRQYIGARYVPIFGRGRGTSVDWDNSDAYEPLSIVYYQGDTYTSRRYVPAGIAIDNQDYWVITGRYNAQVEQYRQEVLSFQGQIDTLRTDLESDYVPFPDTDHYPKYGTLGQVLTTLADGETKWEDPVVPSDAQAETVITQWLNDHPEATTTVQDNSITTAKLQTGAVTTAKMQDNSITSIKIQDGAITETKLANSLIRLLILNQSTAITSVPESLSLSSYAYGTIYMFNISAADTSNITDLPDELRGSNLKFDILTMAGNTGISNTSQQILVTYDNRVFIRSQWGSYGAWVKMVDASMLDLLANKTIKASGVITSLTESLTLADYAYGTIYTFSITASDAANITDLPEELLGVAVRFSIWTVAGNTSLSGTSQQILITYDNRVFIRSQWGSYGPWVKCDTDVPMTVTVSKAGNGNYTSLLQALYETTADVHVIDGTFDIKSEYEDYFGQGYFEQGYDRSSVEGYFKWGLWVNERKLTFGANTRVDFDLTGTPAYNVQGDDGRFCLFLTGSNATIEGCEAHTNYNWYSIHDDNRGTGITKPTTNTFKNCVIIAENMINRNVIGGGLYKNRTTIIEDCYFNNGYAGSPSSIDAQTIRYHNNYDMEYSTTIVKDTYVNGYIFFGYYGTQTEKSTAIVNNCSMGAAIDVSAQAPDMAENIQLYEWANVIRSA